MKESINKIKALLMLDPNRSLADKKRMRNVIDAVTNANTPIEEVEQALIKFGVKEERIAGASAVVLKARQQGFNKAIVLDLLSAIGLPDKQLSYIMAVGDVMMDGTPSETAAKSIPLEDTTRTAEPGVQSDTEFVLK